MFGCETVYDCQVGSPLLWKGKYIRAMRWFCKGDYY